MAQSSSIGKELQDYDDNRKRGAFGIDRQAWLSEEEVAQESQRAVEAELKHIEGRLVKAAEISANCHFDEDTTQGRLNGAGLAVRPTMNQDGTVELEVFPYAGEGWQKFKGSVREAAQYILGRMPEEGIIIQKRAEADGGEAEAA
jgi:hypothetical protein